MSPLLGICFASYTRVFLDRQHLWMTSYTYKWYNLFKIHQPWWLSRSIGIARLLLAPGTGCNRTKLILSEAWDDTSCKTIGTLLSTKIKIIIYRWRVWPKKQIYLQLSEAELYSFVPAGTLKWSNQKHNQIHNLSYINKGKMEGGISYLSVEMKTKTIISGFFLGWNRIRLVLWTTVSIHVYRI